MASPVEIFCCYAREDQLLLEQLKTHLMPLQQRQGHITLWADTNINAGTEWEREIDKHLNTAQIILLLISPDFMNSEYCYSKEMQRAMERHEQKEAQVIPVILRPCSWKDTPFSKLQALPTDAIPVTSRKWHDLDEAFLDIAEGIRRIVTPPLIQQYLAKGEAEHDQHRYVVALSTYQKIIDELDRGCADAYLGKGKALEALGRSKDALVAYNEAIHLEPKEASSYERKGQVLLNLYYYDEALEALKQAIIYAPESSPLRIQRGKILQYLNRYEEALEAYNTAISLNVNVDPEVYYQKGNILEHLARQAYSIATQHGYITKDQNFSQELSTTLEKLSKEMVVGLEMPVLVKNIVETITRALGADASSLYLIEPGTRILSLQAAAGYHSVLLGKGARYDLDHDRGVTAWIANARQKFTAQNTDELHQHPEWQGRYVADQGGREPNAFLGIPLKFFEAGGTEKVIGVLKIEVFHRPHYREPYFTDQDILLAEMMGSVITTVCRICG